MLIISRLFAAIVCISLASAASAEDKPKVEEVSFAHIKLASALPEGPQSGGLFGDIEETLSTVIARFEKAADDAKVTGIIVQIDSPGLGLSQVTALRKAIADVRAKGKLVHAYLDDASNLDYLLATACDDITMPEPATWGVLGLRAEVTFYKNLFDLAGVKADILRVGEFKSAGEPYTRSEMSPEFRKELEDYLDDSYDLLVTQLAESRKLPREKITGAIDAGPLTAKQAQELMLIDCVGYMSDLEAALATNAETKVKVVEKYGKKKADTDMSGLAGFIKLMDALSGTETSSKKLSKEPKIAIIYANGAISTGRSSADLFGESSMGSDTMIEAIRQAAKEETVKAIVLRIDSPGGSALASDLMWHELELVKKPFIVSMGNVAGSGGYYIAMGADRIFAEPGTLTGSIGVVGGKVALEGLYSKFGLSTTVISRGKNAGIFSMTTPFSNEERESLQKMLNEIYAQFTTKAAAGRKMPVEELEKLARGRIYSGRAALKLGLVDELGTLDDAIAYAKKQAKLEGKIEKLLLPKPVSPFDALFDTGTAAQTQARASLQALAAEISPELAQQSGHLQFLKLLRGERSLTIMPFSLRMR